MVGSDVGDFVFFSIDKLGLGEGDDVGSIGDTVGDSDGEYVENIGDSEGANVGDGCGKYPFR